MTRLVVLHHRTVDPKVEGSSPFGLVDEKATLTVAFLLCSCKGARIQGGLGEKLPQVVGVTGSIAAARGAELLWGVNGSERRVQGRSQEPLRPLFIMPCRLNTCKASLFGDIT